MNDNEMDWLEEVKAFAIDGALVIDLFAGGGCASTGIEQAIGRAVDIAINHDPEAVALHQANHPQTRHFVSDVFEVDPLVVTDAQAEWAASGALQDAIKNEAADARFTRAAASICGENAGWKLVDNDRTIQCTTKRGQATRRASL